MPWDLVKKQPAIETTKLFTILHYQIIPLWHSLLFHMYWGLDTCITQAKKPTPKTLSWLAA